MEIKKIIENMLSKIRRHLPNLLSVNKWVIFIIEKFFYWYGKLISQHPLKVILLCTLLAVISLAGLLNFKAEERPFKLWIPESSVFTHSMNWQLKNFPEKFRPHGAMYEADNILTSKAIIKMLEIHNKITKTQTPETNWKTVCAKVPLITADAFLGRKKRSLDPRLKVKRLKRSLPWWMDFLPRKDYCDVLDFLPEECLENSLLEIWGYDVETIYSLTDEDVIKAVNEISYSSIYRVNTNFTKLLSGVERDANGRITKAKTALHFWISEINEEDIKNGDTTSDIWTGIVVDRKGFEWEKELISRLKPETEKSGDIKFYMVVASSFSLITEDTINGDFLYIALGFLLVFIYTQMMLGKFNLVEQRPVLSFFGLVSIALSVIVAIGICSAFGILYGPLNAALPFLLLGLGVDDMFVILQSWDNLKETPVAKLDLYSRLAHAVKNSGLSITITSLTDAAAFAIGSFTIIPALRSFSLYASVGIMAVFFFQTTFFVAWFALDQKRLEDNRQGLFWCIRFKNYVPNKLSQKQILQTVFDKYISVVVTKTPAKILVIFLTLGLLGVSGWGLSKLEQKFDPIWFLPQNSYLFNFFTEKNLRYPDDGIVGKVFVGNFSIQNDTLKLDYLVDRMKANKYIGEVDSWYEAYKTYWGDTYDNISSLHNGNESLFLDTLNEFLYSPIGFKYRIQNFKFVGNNSCNQRAPPITAFSIIYKHKILHGSAEQINAMDQIHDMVKDANFSGTAVAWSINYSGFETDKIIEAELYRNIAMALVVIGLITLFLICSIRTSLLVIVCVIFTLVDVGAVMYWWGLTIDTASCLGLQLSIGLCVDYAAHVAHNFMMQTGTRNERAKKALTKIGPAVFNGGFTTILSLALLSASEAHVFQTFFKIFTTLTVYGLYHSLIFLPVVLSLIGKPSYRDEDVEETTSYVPANNNEITILPVNGNVDTEKFKESYRHEDAHEDSELQSLSIR